MATLPYWVGKKLMTPSRLPPAHPLSRGERQSRTSISRCKIKFKEKEKTESLSCQTLKTKISKI